MSESLRTDLHEANRLSWNAATLAHNSHKGDQAAFFRAGGSTLFPEELELLGPLAGRMLVHLQCNAGQDTLSLARLGAVATGVDISDEAIDFARRLSAESGVPATFERADVYAWLAETADGGRRFDLAFSSYGAVCWLTDLDAWARGIARILAPGGRFVLVEFHPAAMMYDENLRLRFPYSSREPIEVQEGVGDYVAGSGEGLIAGEQTDGAQDFRNPYRSYEIQWGTAEVAQALIGAGLRIETLREWTYSNGWSPFRGMRAEPGRRFRMPDGYPDLPLMYGVSARLEG
ncbi:class I SAM-dependent methyltransferase [Longimicrobium sp.]|uniref:class I SAM-dependent methyltransferase n=1 Tax=Longimicrobium sp. TaxID=2029185 RepID=UPI002F92DECB